MSNSTLRVLVVEDSDVDARLITHELRKAGFEPTITRVQTEHDFLAYLKSAPDIILCDYNLPQFDALRALEILKEQGTDIPILIVSGSIGEEVAVRTMQCGASDYLLKDRLGRLGMAVRQAITKRTLHQAEQKAKAAEYESAKRLDLALASTGMSVWEWDVRTDTVYWSEGCYQIFRTDVFDGTVAGLISLIHPEDVERVKQAAEIAIETRSIYSAEYRFIDRHTTEVRWLSNFGRCEYDSDWKPLRMVGTVQDITERKLNEVALKTSQERLEEAQRIAGIGSWTWDPVTGKVWWSEETFRLFGLDPRCTTPSYEELLKAMHPDDRHYVRVRLRALLNGASSTEHEIRITRRDGKSLWLNTRAHATRDDEGRLIRLEGTDQDITERKMAAEAIAARESRLRETLDSMIEGCQILDFDYRYLYLNASACKHNRKNLDELLGIRMVDAYPGVESTEIFAIIQLCMTERISRKLVNEFVFPDGTKGTFELSILPVPEGVSIQSIETTDRVQAEQALRASEARYRTLAESLPQLVWMSNADGKLEYLNARCKQYTGLPLDDLTHWTLKDIVHPDDHDQTVDRWLASLETGQQYDAESRLRRFDGEYRWHIVRGVPLLDEHGQIMKWFGTCTDNHGQKLAEAALRESEERLSMCVRAANEGIWDYDLRTGEVWWNEKYAEMLGGQSSSPESSIDLWLERIHPDDRIRIQDDLFGAMDGNSDRWSGEYRLRRSNGTYADVYDRALIAREPDGTSKRILGAMLDLSDRRRAETLLRAVMTSVPDAILTISETCIIKTVNPATERMFGYAAAELIGQSITLLLFGQDQTEEQLAEQFHSMAARVGGQPLEIFSCRRDGSGFPAELTVTDFLLEDGRFFTCVVREVSERKKLEAQFLQSQKMEAVGQLAGGVAHDFNNLLMVISGYCELIMDELPADDPQRAAIMEINNAGNRAAGLTRQLLAFSRQQIMEPTSVDLNELVTRAESMIRRLIRENVIVKVKLAPFLLTIKADSVQIDQVLLNLIVNSRDAMPDGGLVTIETSMLEVFDDEPRANGIEVPPGHYVQLTVSDTGCGMSEEIRARIFEPFFTTKAVGKGTGLGLPVVHGIVKQSGGQIRVHSIPWKGTTFEILFPAEFDRNVKPEVAYGSVEDFHGSETVLLVEDEKAVRQIARQVLESHGYRVLEAVHGVDALEVAARHQEPVDLLLTDMVMPEMGGRQLVEIMRSRQPAIRVLCMSGYIDDSAVLNRGDTNTDALICKPFSPKALVKKVREILDRVD